MTTYSFTLLDVFETCPHQAHERFWKKRRFPMGPDAQKGVDIHKALENRLVRAAPLAPEYAQWEPMCASLAGRRGDLYAERKLAVDGQMQPCGFFDDAAFLRASLDVLILADDVAVVGDWKTGRPLEKDLQHMICAALVMENFPLVETVHGFNLWLREGQPGKLHTYTRDSLRMLWGQLLGRVKQVEDAERSGRWEKTPGPLCGWCGVTECQFNKNRGGNA